MKPLTQDEVKNVLHAELKTALGSDLVRRVTTDSRDVKPGDLFFAIRGEHFNGHDFIDQAIEAGAVAIVMDLNVPASDIARRQKTCLMKVPDTIAALGTLAKYYRNSLKHRVTVIAVTGSNGKTTTREMIYHALSKPKRGYRSPASYNNNIGVPLTLLNIGAEHEFAVIEIGSNAPGEVAELSRMACPDIAVITSVGPAHLAGFGDVEGVSKEKCSIIAGLKERGVVICSAQHQATLERVRALGRPMISFGVDVDADVSAHDVVIEPGRVSFKTNDRCEITLPIAGTHNVSNAMAALATVRRLGVSTSQFAAAMTDFKMPPGRMNYLDFNGITVIDDSYNANPASMAAALAELQSHRDAPRRVLICGDMGELGPASQQEHHKLGERVARSNIDALLTVGKLGAVAAKAALEAGMGRGSVQRAVTSQRLARLVKTLINDGDVILVKASRMMRMEAVVKSLSRWRGSGTKISASTTVRSATRDIPSKTPARHYVPNKQ
ncbi:MAG: UDP-N-acetylmuramoyl-tripeptide--D-alanyl-D-alanine ligase [Sedimentisphaerales bacterium]|nr:UDP-N-acetylmuramoyl-tripeptide--D-alanyl-D-alanine ligase [Sedimentisphaerales bacterium]